MLKFIKALSVFLGTIIGVGIFGLPYVASKSGFFVVFVYFLVLSTITIIVHLLFGEITIETEGYHRLPGYVARYLGLSWKNFSLLVISFEIVSALLAYLIVGGEFLDLLLSPYFGGSVLVYTILFFSIGAYLIFRGIKSISQVEIGLLFIFFGVLVLFFVKAFPCLNLRYLGIIDWRFFSFPYGVVLFSLWGSALIPEVKEMLEGDAKKLKNVVISGISIASAVYLFFIFIVYGSSGPNTTKEAISGLAYILGNNIVRLGFIFGIITCFTSFLALGLTLKKVLWYDFGLSKNLSWFIACFLPLFLFLLKLREFINVIGFGGALAIGAEGIIIVFLYKEFLKKRFSKAPNPLLYTLPVFFLLGVVLEIFYLKTV